jgi:putative DNA methylase
MTRREPPRLLIEDWLPATAIGIECMRERNNASALTPLTYLHVWWARRPLAASRAAVLGSLLPADFDRATFDRLLGMTERHAIRAGEIELLPGSAATERAQGLLDAAKAAGRQIPNPHGVRAFRNPLRRADLDRAHDAVERLWGPDVLVADPMAGGGSIPFEALRLGFPAFASDYNPVAATVLEATLRFPIEHGPALATAAKRWAAELRRRVVDEMRRYFPGAGLIQPYSYLFARTVPCPDTAGNPPTPLVPDWHLVNKDSKRVVADPVVVDASNGRWTIRIREIGSRAGQLARPPAPTYSDGKGVSLYAGTAISSDHIKAMARDGKLGHAMYAVVHKVPGGLEFRPPTDADLAGWRQAERELATRRLRWEAGGVIPTELYPEITTDERPMRYGMPRWADMYSPRQLLGFGFLVETLRAMRSEVLTVEGESRGGAVLTLLAFAIDKLANYNSLLASWDATKGGSRSVFDRHDFSFKATYSEMSIVYPGAGLEWALANVMEAYTSLARLPRDDQARPMPTVWQGSATNIPMVPSGSVTAVVVDPPYDDNVQYSELADFFYVWLKRTVGRKYPEWYSTYLCEHSEEAVVNLARHRDEDGAPGRRVRGETAEARQRARAFYRDLMAQTFAEARRILRDDGALTVMFTHKKQEAWEALFSALMDGGFRITAAWPVKTESQFSLHQARKNSAESTVLLVARKRLNGGTGYYDAALRAEIAAAGRAAAERLETQGLKPVDQLVGSFGPAMGVFSRFDVVKTDTGDIVPIGVALDLASDAVTEWRVERLAARGIEGIESEGRFVLMCWDVLGAGEFRFNESKLLGHAVGMNADQLVAAGLVEKKGENIRLLPARDRRRDRALTPVEAARQEVRASGRGRAKPDVLRVHPNDPQFRTALDGCHALALRFVEAPMPEAGIGAAKGLATRQGWTGESGVARLMDALVRAAPEAVRRPVGRDSAAERYPEFRAWHAMLGPLFGLETPDWTPRQRAELTLEDVGLFDAAEPDEDGADGGDAPDDGDNAEG